MKKVISKLKSNRSKRILAFSLIIILVIVLGLLISKTPLRRLLSNVSESNEIDSKDIKFDNSNNDFDSVNMQNAIDELYSKCLKLKNECPEGYNCYKKSDIDMKNTLKESINSISEKLDEKKYLMSDEDINEVLGLINEARGIVYNDDYEKMEEFKNNITDKISKLEELKEEE